MLWFEYKSKILKYFTSALLFLTKSLPFVWIKCFFWSQYHYSGWEPGYKGNTCSLRETVNTAYFIKKQNKRTKNYSIWSLKRFEKKNPNKSQTVQLYIATTKVMAALPGLHNVPQLKGKKKALKASGFTVILTK